MNRLVYIALLVVYFYLAASVTSQLIEEKEAKAYVDEVRIRYNAPPPAYERMPTMIKEGYFLVHKRRGVAVHFERKARIV